LIAGSEYNIYKKPQFWDCYAGFNLELFSEHLQNDFLLSFGHITSHSAQEEGAKDRFMFRFKDNIYFSYDFKLIGFRAGISASLGIYDVPDFPAAWDLFFSAATFAGICIFPKAFIAVTVDVLPGYALAFRVTNTPGASINESGFMLPVSVGLRFNLDKL
ncbi:MAG: hypothetical protein LBG74_03280, partial [Spirochaetaceae bacterium]|nr:hypothetical protein [Spirochaetaceae bacterium]